MSVIRVVYLISLSLTGLIVAAQLTEVSLLGTPILAIVILLHLPVFLSAHWQDRILRPAAKLQGFAEAPFPLFIWIAWILGGIYSGLNGGTLFLGGVFSISIAAFYAAARLVDLKELWCMRIGVHHPYFSIKEAKDTVKKFIFYLRLVVVSVSTIALMQTIMTEKVANWWLPSTLLAVILAIVLVLSFGFNAKVIAKKAAASASTAVTASIAQHPPECAVYYSSRKGTNHDPLIKFMQRFKAEGITTAIIARELHSVSACQSVKADYTWVAGTIDALDTFSQSSIAAAIYINDASKNAHFIRFNEIVHILVPQSDSFLTAETLTTNIAAYDAIVAPNSAIAARWRQNSTRNLSSKVVEISSSSTGLLHVNETNDRKINLALSLSPGSVGKTDYNRTKTIISVLLNWIADSPERRLTVSFRNQQDDQMILDLYLLVQQYSAEIPRIKLVQDAETYAYNRCDMVIATATDDICALGGMGKPIFWLGGDNAPEGMTRLSDDQQTISAQITAEQQSQTMPKAINCHRHKFESFDVLIKSLKQRKNGLGDKT